MPDAPDPPRKFYTFKPVDFENVNGVRPASSLHDTQPLPDPGIIVSDKVRIDVRDLARAATSQPLLSSAPAPMRKNEVHTVLRDNLANAAGLNDLTLDLTCLAAATPSPPFLARDFRLQYAAGCVGVVDRTRTGDPLRLHRG